MSTTTWHAPYELLAAYAAGSLDAVLGASLERHLDGCAECRAAVLPLSDPRLLDEAWASVRTSLESPNRPWLLRVAQRLGLRESTAILLGAAASLRVAWLCSGIVALGFAAAATVMARDYALWPFLLVAPLIPVIGVAASYAPADDPFEALAVTSPHGRTRLILIRTLAVLTIAVPAATLLGLTLPGPTWVAVAWLGPGLSMLSLLLALAGFTGPRMASAVICLLWCGLVVGSSRTMPTTWPVEATQQLAYLALAAAAGGVLLVRSHRTRKIGVVL